MSKAIIWGIIAGTLLSRAAVYAEDNVEAFQKAEAFQKKVYASKEGTLNYRIHIPEKMDTGKKYPLVLFFHGAGSPGDDNTRQIVNGPKDILAYSEATGNPVIILAPQCPKDGRWVNVSLKDLNAVKPEKPSAQMSLVMALLEETVSKLPVDKDRIYVTGLSMGGAGTWDILQRMPSTFAAAIPVCGYGAEKDKAAAIKDVPIWVFHGNADPTVSVKFSQNMVEALKGVGGNVKYTEYDKVGHDAWTRTYSNQEVLKWLFDQRKNKLSSTQ